MTGSSSSSSPGDEEAMGTVMEVIHWPIVEPTVQLLSPHLSINTDPEHKNRCKHSTTRRMYPRLDQRHLTNTAPYYLDPPLRSNKSRSSSAPPKQVLSM